MGLKIYSAANPAAAFSTGGEMTNPVRHAFDGREGGVVEVLYYVRNDDALYEYTGITVTPVDTEGGNIVNGTNGYSWKLKAGNSQPLEEEWETITAGAGISVANITDTTTYLPFWVRMEVPRGADVSSFDDVVFRIAATQSLA